MSEATRATRNPLLTIGLIALLCGVWGSTWLVIKWGLEDLPPFTAATARFGLAALVMVVLAPRLHRAEGGARPKFGLALSVGLGQFSLSYGIVYWTETRLPSGLVSVLWAVFPLLVAGMGHFFLRGERLVLRQWAGFVVAFAGVAVLFLTDVRAVGPGAVPAGLVLLLSPLVCAVSTIYLKRHSENTSSVLLNRDGMVLGALTLAVVAAVAEHDAQLAITVPAVLSVVYLALVGTCLAFGVYLWLMRSVPAYQLSLIAYVSPLIALLLGTFLGDEPLRVETLVGTGVILLGVACASRRQRR